MQKLILHSANVSVTELVLYEDVTLESLTLKDIDTQELVFKLEPHTAKRLLDFIRKAGGDMFCKKFKVEYETSEACSFSNLCPDPPSKDIEWSSRPSITTLEGVIMLEKIKITNGGYWFFTFESSFTCVNDQAI